MPTRLQRWYAVYAWIALAVTIGVIVWGAYVRASGSGAGCGSHWPACNGEVIPRAPDEKMLVEFTHRASSGLSMLVVLALGLWAWRAFASGHRVRRSAAVAVVFIGVEALLGAGLVLFGLTANNDSVFRAVMLAVHLVNTFVLLAAQSLTAWWAGGAPAPRWQGQGSLRWALVGGLVATVLLAAAGAVTALGDTLFPAGSLAEGLAQDASPTAHFLIRLRVIHPLLAVLVGAYGVIVGTVHSLLGRDATTTRLAWWLGGTYVVQLAVGTSNLTLLAPIALQLLHLLLADLFWIVLVLLTVSALAVPAHVVDRQDAVELDAEAGRAG